MIRINISLIFNGSYKYIRHCDVSGEGEYADLKSYDGNVCRALDGN